MTRLTQATDGKLYGISQSTSARTFNLFTSTLAGSVKTVSTVPVPYTRGQGVGPLTPATDGHLWSTAIYNTTGYLNNNGEVFAVSTSGTTEQQLAFSGTNGAAPVAGVIQAASGTLYGTATMKGSDANGNPSYGTVFTIAGLPAK